MSCRYLGVITLFKGVFNLIKLTAWIVKTWANWLHGGDCRDSVTYSCAYRLCDFDEVTEKI